MKIFYGFFLFTIFSFSQESQIESDETIAWINSKFILHSLKDKTQTQQNELEVVVRGSTAILHISSNSSFSPHKAYEFFLPIKDIFDVSFEKRSTGNYLLNIQTSGVESFQFHVYDFNKKEGKLFKKSSSLGIPMNASIETDDLKSRILKAFKYLFRLHGNDLLLSEKF